MPPQLLRTPRPPLTAPVEKIVHWNICSMFYAFLHSAILTESRVSTVIAHLYFFILIFKYRKKTAPPHFKSLIKKSWFILIVYGWSLVDEVTWPSSWESTVHNQNKTTLGKARQIQSCINCSGLQLHLLVDTIFLRPIAGRRYGEGEDVAKYWTFLR